MIDNVSYPNRALHTFRPLRNGGGHVTSPSSVSGHFMFAYLCTHFDMDFASTRFSHVLLKFCAYYAYPFRTQTVQNGSLVPVSWLKRDEQVEC